MKNSSDKKDRLERFVRDNREGFDNFLPQDSLWDRIEGKIPKMEEASEEIKEESKVVPMPTKKPYFYWRIAASLFLALGIGFLVYLNNEYGVTRDPAVALKVPTYAKEFNQYTLAINEKRSEIVRLAKDNPQLQKEFSADLESLEKSYGNLRAGLSNTACQKTVLSAMVQNLQLQMDLLNQQIEILERINKVKNGYDKENSKELPSV